MVFWLGDEKVLTLFINCSQHKERRQKFEKAADKADMDIKRLACVKSKAFQKLCPLIQKKIVTRKSSTNAIEIAISHSHIKAWKRLVASKANYALVMEDDSQFYADAKTKLEQLWDDIHECLPKGFDILHLWNGNWMRTRSRLQSIKGSKKRDVPWARETVPYNAALSGYIIHRRFAEWLLRRVFPISMPIDIRVGQSAKSQVHLTVYCQKNPKTKCWEGPLYRMACDGEYGTGNSTQDYSLPTVEETSCSRR